MYFVFFIIIILMKFTNNSMAKLFNIKLQLFSVLNYPDLPNTPEESLQDIFDNFSLQFIKE
ncbi:unknown; predicted coding region [Mycoplasmopsis pulmonis]|uniref:Uncharacterized protein n=1 Tax=Mycoplasmopsis pulmonis (strain UAB CTIP) TaxID=272635 RepID=Q98QE0_MYCPU|nr:unknown; predicted coding region [Mycoplasmopsis pulmonis]